MIGTGVVALVVLLLMSGQFSGGGGSAKAFTDDELAGESGGKKKSKKPVNAPAPAPAPKKKKKKKALKGGSTMTSDLLDAPKEETKKKKKKGGGGGGGGAKPPPQKVHTKVSQPVHLSQQEEDEGWGVVVSGKKKTGNRNASKKMTAAKAETQSFSAAPAPAAAAGKIPDGNSEIQVKVDGRKLGIIIGPGGATIKAIQESTGTKVDLPDTDKGEERSSGPVMVTISGPADGVAKAKRTIEDLGNKGYSTLTEGGNFTEGAISVPVVAISELIGKRGVIIKTIQDTMEVRLNFPDTKNQALDNRGRPQKKTVKVGIAGDKDKVAKAKQMMKEILKFHHHPITHPGVTHVEIDVEAHLYSVVIGPRGSAIKHIQNSYDVKVHIPNEDSSTDKVLIVGAASDCNLAKKYIAKMIEKACAEPEEQEYDPRQDESYDSRYDDEGPHEAWMDQYAPPPRTNRGWGS